jgi:uncharacterized protein YceH (UPF0502 family)
VAKFRHLLDDALSLTPSELSVLAVLLLRGPQTPGELKGRTERLYPLGSLADVEAVLGRLQERELVAQLPRRPGQKEERYAQLLGGDGDLEAAQPTPAPPHAQDDRLEELEARVARLEDELASLRAALDGLRGR